MRFTDSEKYRLKEKYTFQFSLLFLEKMKSLFSTFLLVCLSGFVSAHEYYFGFAEMQYNPLTKTFETTVVLSAHDFEATLLKSGRIAKSLEFLTADSLTKQLVGDLVKHDFTVAIGSHNVAFESLGYEITKNGMIHIYLLSEVIDLPQEIKISFTSLMDAFPAQQNKLTFIHENYKTTAVFLQHQQQAILKTN